MADAKDQRDKLLKKAEQAADRAKYSNVPKAKVSWKQLEEGYRKTAAELVQGEGAAKTGSGDEANL